MKSPLAPSNMEDVEEQWARHEVADAMGCRPSCPCRRTCCPSTPAEVALFTHVQRHVVPVHGAYMDRLLQLAAQCRATSGVDRTACILSRFKCGPLHSVGSSVLMEAVELGDEAAVLALAALGVCPNRGKGNRLLGFTSPVSRCIVEDTVPATMVDALAHMGANLSYFGHTVSLCSLEQEQPPLHSAAKCVKLRRVNGWARWRARCLRRRWIAASWGVRLARRRFGATATAER